MPLPFVAAIAVRVAIGAAGKIIARQAANAAARKAAEVAARKAAQEAAKKAAAQGLGKQAGTAATRDAAKKAAQESLKKSGGKGPGNTAGKHRAKKAPRKKGPCDHLKKGDPNGKGQYRGGSYGGTKASGVDSHHMPANSVSPLRTSQGPAAQVRPTDHVLTSSHGHQGKAGVLYRAKIESLIKQGKWRDALATEIKDLRRVAQSTGNPKRYDQAIKEMRAYFNCLEKHGLLK